jgi:hypothetical protein
MLHECVTVISLFFFTGPIVKDVACAGQDYVAIVTRPSKFVALVMR